VPKTNKLLIFGVLIFIQVLFGVNFTASKVVVSNINPLLWSNIRFIVAGLLMLAFTLISRREHPKFTPKDLLTLICLSFLGMGLGQALFLYGLNLTTSINTSIITTLIPVLTLVIVLFRRQDEVNTRKVLGILIAFSGVVIMKDFSKLTLSSGSYLGDLCVFTAALCFALYLSYGRTFLQRFDNMWVTTYLFLISGCSMILFNLEKIQNFQTPIITNELIISSIYTILGATILTYFLNNWTLKRVGSANVALFIYLQPVVAAIIGVFYLGEKITLRMAIASLVVLSGIYITSSKKKLN
jgi:drug/metabolite transporter (DMT)-like permease